MTKIIGKVALHPSKSFAFVKVDDSSNPLSLFVPPPLAKDVFYGDLVEVEYEPSERPTVANLTVLHSPDRRFTGKVIKKYGNLVIVADNYINKEFKIQVENEADLLDRRVVVEMQPSEKGLIPVICYVADLDDEPFSETQLTLAKYQISQEELVCEKQNPSFEHYADLTHLPFVTVDSESTQDVDDALFAQKVGDAEWRLWVAIADASAYVPMNSTLDKAARMRGTTFYFPSKVVTMLPGQLSHDLCSLLPHKVRPALVAQMLVSAEGVVLEQLQEAMICSHRKMSYQELDNFAQGLVSLETAIADSLSSLLQIYDVLFAQRCARGANVERSSSWYIVTDSQGKMTEVTEIPWSLSYGVVEECMSAANSQVAKFMASHDIPGIYRHQPHPEESVLSESLLPVYHDLVGEQKEPSFSVWKNAASANPRYVKALRMALGGASYDSQNYAHFSLQYGHYAHFTSPIRRYPDLWNHRVLKAFLRKEDLTEYRAQVEEVAATCSIQHNVAKRAPRYLEKLLLVNYAQKHLATLQTQPMQALVSGGNSRGIFVEADHVLHGMVSWEALARGTPEWEWDAVLHKGQLRQSRALGVGDSLLVNLVNVDSLKLRLEFEEVDEEV